MRGCDPLTLAFALLGWAALWCCVGRVVARWMGAR